MNGQQEAQQSTAAVVAKLGFWGTLAAVWVTVPLAIRTLLVLMAFDYVSGLLSAVANRKLCSRLGLRGLAKKIQMLVLVAAAHIISAPLGLGFDLGSAVAIALAINEVISLAENCAETGIPIPPVLSQVLSKAKEVTGRGRSAEDVKRELEGEQGKGAGA